MTATPTTPDPDDDDLLVIEDDEPEGPGGDGGGPRQPPWCLLVVDDEQGVHDITRLALRSLSFKGRGIEILNAYSGREALELLRRRRDVAVILLDVVMETDDAGLACARAIREELRNQETRIILRTGQPGQAPEQRVILDYDINDYKAKTDLTAQKLTTTIIAALRTYDHIMTIEASRKGLDMVVDAASSLFMARSVEQFHSGILLQVQAMLGMGEHGMLCVQRGGPLAQPPGILVLAASGRYREAANRPLAQALPAAEAAQIAESFAGRRSIFAASLTTLYIATPTGREVVVSIDSNGVLPDPSRQVIETFAAKISQGFENMLLFHQFRQANRAAQAALAGGPDRARLAALAEATARRLAEAGPHAGRVDEAVPELVGLALLLPSTPEATAGFDLAAEVMATRGAHWDGQGSPTGLSGEDIPLAARIVAVAEAWAAGGPAVLQAGAGGRFDPAVVDAFLAAAGAA
ncbi:DUF3369 domain-containing protein [Aerophototrophica crusticola]|uniref:DUF3369 domain-containing protein n=1 Tax=Aerophototrophica crusticola TaxID=1709002 RepID=A0A858RAV1_9PROT|nr:DUF3369 domain-containing protein [Rhodospirillaceae bacterium B3]